MIYYFSGSGNSLAVARDLADRLGSELQAMARHPEGVTVPPSAEVIGLVFPSHDFQAPAYVQSWLSRINGIENSYVFAVMTYGISAGAGLKKLDAVIRSRGGKLSAAFALMMPHNGIGSSLQDRDVRESLLDAWRTRRNEIAATIRARRTTTIDRDSMILGFLRNRSWKMLPGLFRYLGVWIREGEQGLSYHADHRCIRCGVCAGVCPVGNIKIAGGGPTWGEACVSCFACLHWCPQGATRLSSRDLRIDHAYHHPDVLQADMLTSAGRNANS
jgi:ferredoxin